MAQTPKSDVIAARYASPEMTRVFDLEKRARLWRELWITLAEAQKELGLPITQAQIAELKRFQDKINWDVIEKKEKELRHDVMAHVHAYGQQCKKAAGIIHLGATSAYVTDNADLILMREGLEIILGKVVAAIDRLAAFAEKEKNTATCAFTHFQPAQPTTVGKRACLWTQDFVMDLQRLEFEMEEMRFKGVKGATGTQDSFLKLFGGDRKKVLELDRLVMERMGFDKSFYITGQTYPRKADTKILTALANVAESASKFGNDIRLLQALHEVEEPIEESQVGSSAMPYKQNPMRSERMVGLARYVMNLIGNCYDTAANQWFERTLDDSANRRLTIPHAFLVCDGTLNLAINVAAGLRVNHAVIEQDLDRELPFLQTEEILMAAVREGGNRQYIHERIQKHSRSVVRDIREKGAPNDLLARLRKDPAFRKVPPRVMVRANPTLYVGMAPDQVTVFLRDVIDPIRSKYKSQARQRPEIRV